MLYWSQFSMTILNIFYNSIKEIIAFYVLRITAFYCEDGHFFFVNAFGEMV